MQSSCGSMSDSDLDSGQTAFYTPPTSGDEDDLDEHTARSEHSNQQQRQSKNQRSDELIFTRDDFLSMTSTISALAAERVYLEKQIKDNAEVYAQNLAAERAKVDELCAELDSQNAIENVEREMDTLRNEINILKAINKTTSERLDANATKLSDKSKTIAALNDEVSALRESRDNLLIKHQFDREHDSSALTLLMTQHRLEVEQHKEHIGRLQVTVENMDAEKDGLKRQISSLRDRRLSDQNKMTSNDSTTQEKDERIMELEMEKLASQEEMHLLRLELTERDVTMAELRAEMDKMVENAGTRVNAMNHEKFTEKEEGAAQYEKIMRRIASLLHPDETDDEETIRLKETLDRLFLDIVGESEGNWTENEDGLQLPTEQLVRRIKSLFSHSE